MPRGIKTSKKSKEKEKEEKDYNNDSLDESIDNSNSSVLPDFSFAKSTRPEANSSQISFSPKVKTL